MSAKRKKLKNVRPLGKFDYALIGAVIISIVSVVAVNFITSYGHIYTETLAYSSPTDRLGARLTPVGIDGMLLALGLTNVFATMHGRGHFLLRAALFFGVAGTVAVNGAYGAGWGVTGGLLATWSPVALFISVESGLYVFRIMNDIATATAKPKRGRPAGTSSTPQTAPRAPRAPRQSSKGTEVAIPEIRGRVIPVDVLNPFEDASEAA